MPRILFGDDDTEQRKLFQILLEGAGHEVHLAATGVDVLNQLEAGAVDLVIVDLRFPTSADGLALIRRIRQNGFERPVLLLSGWAEEIFGHPEEELVSHIIVKPVPIPELLEMIGTLTR